MWALVEVEEVREDFRGWDHQEGGSPRRIRMDLEGTLAVMVDRVVTRTSSLGLEAWVRAAEAGADTRVVQVEAGEMEGTEEEVEAGMEVLGGMTIVIVIIMGEVMTVEVEEAITEALGVTVNVGEVAEAVVGDTELSGVYTFPNSTVFVLTFCTYRVVVQRDTYSQIIAGTGTYITQFR